MDGEGRGANIREIGSGQEIVQPDYQESYSVPDLSAEIEHVASLVFASFIVVGAFLATIDLNPFWIAFAIWALLIAFLAAIEQRNLRFVLAWWLLAPISLPFIAEVAGVAVGFHPLEITSPFSWFVEAVSLFTLCLMTMALIDIREEMHLQRPFLVLTTFLLFESVLVLQGLISWHSDLSLGTNLIPSGNDFIEFYILNTLTGLMLTCLVLFIFRKGSYDKFRKRMAFRGEE